MLWSECSGKCYLTWFVLTIIILKHSIRITSNNYKWLLPTQLDWKEIKIFKLLKKMCCLPSPAPVQQKTPWQTVIAGGRWEGGAVILMINICIMSVSQSVSLGSERLPTASYKLIMTPHCVLFPLRQTQIVLPPTNHQVAYVGPLENYLHHFLSPLHYNN